MENVNKKELENSLPDYIFGKLSDIDSKKFAESIADFPELKSELESAQKAFSDYKNINWDAHYNDRTRNLSVYVHRRLQNKKRGFSLFKIFLPIATVSSMALAGLFILNNSNDKSINTEYRIQSKKSAVQELTVADSKIASSPLVNDESAKIKSGIKNIVEKSKGESKQALNKETPLEQNESNELADLNMLNTYRASDLLNSYNLSDDESYELVASSLELSEDMEINEDKTQYYNIISNLENIDENILTQIFKEIK
jgi:hypothetical protein